MNKRFAIIALAVVVCTAATAVAGFDGRIRIDTCPWQAGSGGEFKATIVSGNLGRIGMPADQPNSFQTFCAERNENISFGGVYDANVNTKTVASNKFLTPEVAYMYYHFRARALQGYDYSSDPGRRSSAEALQNAIWFSMGEGGASNSFYEVAYEATHLGKDGKITWKGYGPVRVLNLFNGPPQGGHNQDQLTIVPAPGAAVLGAIGLALVRWVRRSA